MIFCHIRTGNEDDGFADETELRDAACAGTADDQVGSLIGSPHIADEVGDDEVGGQAPLSSGNAP